MCDESGQQSRLNERDHVEEFRNKFIWDQRIGGFMLQRGVKGRWLKVTIAEVAANGQPANGKFSGNSICN